MFSEHKSENFNL